jgi:hypothetical protein
MTPTHPDVWLDESNPKMQKMGLLVKKIESQIFF